MKSIKILILFSLISILLVACSAVPPPPPPVDEQVLLATMVAETVQAALDEPSAETPIPTNASVDNNAPAPVAPTAEAAPLTAVPQPVRPATLTVAYVKDGNVYVWAEGGSSIGLTNTGDARKLSISSDGQRIAYVRELASAPPAYELWVVNSDGALLNPQLLVSQVEMNALKAASQFTNADGFDFDQVEFRPGTHDLYYSTVPRFMGPGYAPSYDLRMVNVDTLAKSTLFDFGQAGAFTFSPDGAQIVLSAPDHISLVNADGSNFRENVLMYPLVITYSEYQYHPRPKWSVDSASLRVAVPPADPLADPLPPTALWYLPIDGSPATQLASIPAIPFDWPDNAFSPDMSYIAYVKNVGDPTENQRELHIAYADGSNDYIVATGENLSFRSWLPDSTRFTYSFLGTSDTGLYLGNLSGGDAFTIASLHQTVQQMSWVDASRFIYIHGNNGAFEFRISDQDGTNHAFIDTLTDSFAGYDFTQ